MVIQQVDLVDIQQTPVGSCQHARLEAPFAFLDGFFDIQCSDHTVFCGADRQVDETDLALAGLQVFARAYLFLDPI